jgi:uncharacterized membrane protein
MSWISITFLWYLMLFSLGMIFIPLTKKIFGRVFVDIGYPFAKIIAIILLSYTVFLLGSIKLLAFTQLNVIMVVIGFFAVNYLVLVKSKKTVVSNRGLLKLIIFQEILFLLALFFWVYVRGQEPSIRGLEKFMDFGFINAALKSRFFPPLDMWLSGDAAQPNGYPINYYYFGHLTGAVLIKMLGVNPAVGYNLILATIFALAVTEVFSLSINLIHLFLPKKTRSVGKLIFFGLISSFIVNLGGNLHTIYLFTKGYPNEQPIPFWQILSYYNPTKYWYPNATRFIPFTIHEFPIYSYVVADLHGHVFDIPFVVFTLTLLLLLFVKAKKIKTKSFLTFDFVFKMVVSLGFLMAVHYMTNAFDGPIYILLTIFIFFLVFRLSLDFIYYSLLLTLSFLIFSLPFSSSFTPFASGIGLNCSPDFLTKIGKLGPFLFEKGNCQPTPFWMMFVLWGFFWISAVLFVYVIKSGKTIKAVDRFVFLLFLFGTFLVIIPEFFYIKDIYPNHFRANTMFKLGYQAFMMMGVASGFVFFRLKQTVNIKSFLANLLFLFFFFFVVIYPIFAIPSYYGALKKIPLLDGAAWLENYYPEDKEIIDYLNKAGFGDKNPPVILEAQGDSYTDYERISAYTGLPTVAGWWVHEWLWRGSPEIVGKRIPDINALYESDNLEETKKIIKKYRIKYVVISKMEKQKYQKLNEDKFGQIGKKIFQSSNGFGALYQVE